MHLAALADGRLDDDARAALERELGNNQHARLVLASAADDAGVAIDEAPVSLQTMQAATALVPAPMRTRRAPDIWTWRIVRAGVAVAACIAVGVSGYRIGTGSVPVTTPSSDDLVQEMTFGVFGDDDDALLDSDFAVLAQTMLEVSP